MSDESLNMLMQQQFTSGMDIVDDALAEQATRYTKQLILNYTNIPAYKLFPKELYSVWEQMAKQYYTNNLSVEPEESKRDFEEMSLDDLVLEAKSIQAGDTKIELSTASTSTTTSLEQLTDNDQLLRSWTWQLNKFRVLKW